MRIKNHRLEGAPYSAARLMGGIITPSIVVLHDTAGRLEKGNSAAYLATTPKASVHFVVERDGTVSQLVPANRRAGHAGQSSYHGREDCNDFSIGIEIVNPGKMDGNVLSGTATAWWGEIFNLEEWGIRRSETKEHGAGYWMPYAEEQIDAVTGLLSALFDAYSTLQDITTHWYVSPRRKVDTNPLFPLDHVRARILGRDDPVEEAAIAASEPFADREAMVEIEAPSGLNLRRWPSFNPNVLATIPDGTIVPVLRAGEFGGRQWLRVLYSGHEGWIVARYAAPIVYP